jgi:hypothetical protein
MSIARGAISEVPLGAEPQASRKGIAPPLRRSIARADTVQQPEPR